MYTVKYRSSDPFVETSLALFMFLLALLVYTEVKPSINDRMLDFDLEECTGCRPEETTIYDERIATPPDNILGVF